MHYSLYKKSFRRITGERGRMRKFGRLNTLRIINRLVYRLIEAIHGTNEYFCQEKVNNQRPLFIFA
jgi:hypothetical protein